MTGYADQWGEILNRAYAGTLSPAEDAAYLAASQNAVDTAVDAGYGLDYPHFAEVAYRSYEMMLSEHPEDATMTDDTPEIVPAAAELNAPQRCPNCEGTGWSRSRTHVNTRSTVRCWMCTGTLTVILPVFRKLHIALRARGVLTDDKAEMALGLVERDEPHRLDRMWASVERGRIDDVVTALVAYYDARAAQAIAEGRERL